MMKKAVSLLKGETFRYLVFGVLTVVVNVVSYRILTLVFGTLLFGTLLANTLAFFIAVLLAYWTNSRFVFRVPCTKKNFFQFMAMRIGTLFLDDGGMILLLKWGWHDILAKCAVNVFIIVLNYIFSKLLIFKKEMEK